MKSIFPRINYVKMNIVLAVFFFLLCSIISNPANALPFNQISQVFFFGDSLTDGGFNDKWSETLPLPDGKAPTFTTFGGYTWAQYIAHDIKGFVLPTEPRFEFSDQITNNSISPTPGFVSGRLRGVNYAASGSTTNAIGFQETWAPSLHQQIEYYLTKAGQTADPHAIYFIWSGANDIISVLLNDSALPTQDTLQLAADTAVTNIANEVMALSAKGAKRIVVLGLPDIGNTPLIASIAIKYNVPNLPPSMQALCSDFNTKLNTELSYIQNKYNNNILQISTFDLLDNIIHSTKNSQPYIVAGQSFQFVDYAHTACGDAPAIICPSSAPSNYVFADSLHPSDMTHRVISLHVESLIKAWE